ncbi:hypothetical protein [Psychroserpens sp.]|uniref:hypothetical protein n=1 Tax=Psychroserpens sp. TaxID=2020870 RepID=UPI003C786217
MAQNNPENQSEVYTRCYYDHKVKSPLLVYDAVDGHVIDTLYNSARNDAWLRLTILESDYGWFKIKELTITPPSKSKEDYKDYWVKSENFIVFVDHKIDLNSLDVAYLYDLPSTQANRIHKLDQFQKVMVTEVTENWSRVKFEVDTNEIEGWLHLKHQISNPLTVLSKFK